MQASIGLYHKKLTGIERGLSDVAAGRFATDEQVEAVFAKHRRP